MYSTSSPGGPGSGSAAGGVPSAAPSTLSGGTAVSNPSALSGAGAGQGPTTPAGPVAGGPGSGGAPTTAGSGPSPGGAPGPYTAGGMSYQHSPIPGNPTPPLTPQHPGSLPYASPGSVDPKQPFPVQSEYLSASAQAQKMYNLVQ